jgi:hypothetical protein
MTDGAAKIARESTVATVRVISSAPPAPAKIEYIVPTFNWTRTPAPFPSKYLSERKGGLRVYLERPWYSSGEDELLGIVLAFRPSAEIEPFVTRWGRDPLWRSSPPVFGRPREEDFRNAKMVASLRLHKDDMENTEFSSSFVTVIAYGVTIEDGRCFCDIELDPGASYYPMVRLALARFQPHSIPGFELSRVVLADFIQLVPNRAVSVVRLAENVFEVTVTGRTHDSPTDPVNPGDQTGTQIQVSAQRRMRGSLDDVGWLPANEEVLISPQIDTAVGDLLWQGTVTAPPNRRPGQVRLLIEELEVYRRTDSNSPRSFRTVFAETIELSNE